MSPVRTIGRRMQMRETPISKAESGVVDEKNGGNLDSLTSYRLVWYFLSFLIPFAGILIALFFYDQEAWEVRKIGRNCLLIGFVVWILLPTAFLFAVLLFGVVAIAGMASDILSPAD